jgi:Co/Zn/Cd efflux system component
MTVARKLRVPWTLWIAGAIVAVYLAVEELFAYETRTTGLLSPGGHPHFGVLACGLAFLALRMAARFVAPGLVVWTGVAAALDRAWLGRR